MEGAQLCHLALFQGPRVAPPQEDVDRDGQVQLTVNIEGYFAVSEDAMAKGVEAILELMSKSSVRVWQR